MRLRFNCSIVCVRFHDICNTYRTTELNTLQGTSHPQLEFWISIIKILKLLASKKRHLESSSRHTGILSIYQTLMKYRFKNLFLRDSLTQSMVGQMRSEFRLVGLGNS